MEGYNGATLVLALEGSEGYKTQEEKDLLHKHLVIDAENIKITGSSGETICQKLKSVADSMMPMLIAGIPASSTILKI